MLQRTGGLEQWYSLADHMGIPGVAHIPRSEYNFLPIVKIVALRQRQAMTHVAMCNAISLSRIFFRYTRYLLPPG